MQLWKNNATARSRAHNASIAENSILELAIVAMKRNKENMLRFNEKRELSLLKLPNNSISVWKEREIIGLRLAKSL